MSANVLVLSCSPRGNRGNSAAMASYLQTSLRQRGASCETAYLAREMHAPEELLRRAGQADVWVLTLPVYENTVPGLAVRFFEYLYGNRDSLPAKERRLFAAANSGFPEPEAGAGAAESCRLFARAMGFAWLGGVNAAPGTMMGDGGLERTGGTYEKLRRALDLAADAIAGGAAIPQKTFELLSKPLFNPVLYRFFGKIIQKGKYSKALKTRTRIQQ